MTLEEANQKALAASERGDLNALDAALKARASAIAALAGSPPSQELAARLTSAIQAGEALSHSLSTLKARLLASACRLTRFQTGLNAVLAPPKNSLDCRG
jgi:hypothetical protein